MSEYWQTIEKYTNKQEKDNIKVSGDYLYLKSACLSLSASLTRPVELVKFGLQQLFKNTRKKLEPIGKVDYPLTKMLILRSHLNKTYLEEFKRTTSFTFPGWQKSAESLSDEDSAKIKRLMKNHVRCRIT